MDIFEDKEFGLELPEKGGATIGILGSSRSGKTHCLMRMLQMYFKNHVTNMMTGSSQADIYKETPKHVIISPQYIPRVIKDCYMINKETENSYDFLNILDDIVTGVKFDKEVLKALCVYRNSNCSIIINAQAVSLLNSAGRTNFHFVFLFHFNTDEQIEKAIKAYLKSYFPDGMKMAQMIRAYRELTEDHHFFVIDNINGGVWRTKAPE